VEEESVQVVHEKLDASASEKEGSAPRKAKNGLFRLLKKLKLKLGRKKNKLQ